MSQTIDSTPGAPMGDTSAGETYEVHTELWPAPDPQPPLAWLGWRWRLALLSLIVLGLGGFSAAVGWFQLPLGSGPAIGGYNCPLCGGTRAWWALWRGRLAESFAYNPLVWVLSPVLAYMFASMGVWFVTGRPLPGFRDPWAWPRRWFWPLAIVTLGFTALRNVPVWPLTFLAP